MTHEPIAEASLSDDRGPHGDPVRLCAQCGRAVEGSQRHPVAATHTAEGDLVVYLFCSASCRDDWSVPGDRRRP